jgi:hypothetical protein
MEKPVDMKKKEPIDLKHFMEELKKAAKKL